MSKAKRLLSFFLAIFAFVVFCCSGVVVQSVAAVAGVDDAIIAILIAALAALGITFVTTGAFDSLEDYIGSLIEEYAQSQSVPVSQIFRGVQYGRNNLGQILLNNRFVVVISAIVEFIKAKFTLSNNSSITLQEQSAMLGNVEFIQLPVYGTGHNGNNGQTMTVRFEQSRGTKPIYIVEAWNHYYAVSNESNFITVTVDLYDSNMNVINHDVTEMRLTKDSSEGINNAQIDYSDYYYFSGMENNWTPGMKHAHIADVRAAINTYSQIVATDGLRIQTGAIYNPTLDNDYTSESGAILDVGADWGDSLDVILDDVIPDAFSESEVGSATLTLDTEDEISDQIEEEPILVDSNAENYQVSGLADVFPFCIPFDLYNFVDCLAADPVAPSFQWRFYVPGIVDETITIDLEPYDSVAQLLRTMELLLFCVGLAFVTRKIIRG